MDFEKLLEEHKIERVETTELNFDSVKKDIKFSEKGMETKNYDRVMVVVYEAVLKAGSKLMNSLGYRAIGKEHHKNVFEFLAQCIIDQELTAFFDTIRKKRNDFMYRDVQCISKEEAEQIINKAKLFVRKMRTFVRKMRT